MRFRNRQVNAAALGAALTTGITVFNTGMNYWNRYASWRQEQVESRRFIVVIDDDDNLWYPVRVWLMEQVEKAADETEPQRLIHVTWESPGALRQKEPEFKNVEYQIAFQGVNIDVDIVYPSLNNNSSEGMMSVGSYRDREMRFICPDLATREALLEHFRSIAPKNARERKWVYHSRKAGGWSSVRTVPDRPLDSLILPDGMLDELITDLERFYTNEAAYNERGIPWHRGYLLHGPPGTGKSSTITALGNYFNRNVFFLSLSGIESDSALTSCIAELPSEALLVIEDVDVFHATHTRKNDDDPPTTGATLGGLLNILDGILTPHGLVTFMTTNFPDRLDDALIRPGRADRSYHLGYLNQTQLDAMVSRFVDPNLKIPLERDDVSPASVVECLKGSFDQTPEYIRQCIQEIVSQ